VALAALSAFGAQASEGADYGDAFALQRDADWQSGFAQYILGIIPRDIVEGDFNM
jgi:hypothetical protein